MDDLVLRGMAKWPNVPAVYGWLSLDRRGQWFIKGERISNPTVTAFIGRNYEHDERGCWFFQNGPQRVFVQLGYAPLALRVMSAADGALELEAHTGQRPSAVDGAWLDEDGSLLLATNLGPALVDDRDLPRLETSLVDANGSALPEAVLEDLMELAADKRTVPVWFRFRERNVKVYAIHSSEVPAQLGFVREPRPPVGAGDGATMR
jgi:Protein of unknown function (DUF2946)